MKTAVADFYGFTAKTGVPGVPGETNRASGGFDVFHTPRRGRERIEKSRQRPTQSADSGVSRE